MINPMEARLLRQWSEEGDAEAFQQLVTRHAGMVYGTCRRILGDATAAEDAAQTAFLKLAEVPHTVKTSLPGWLHTVATRNALEMIRSDKRRQEREVHFARTQPETVVPQWDEISPLVDELLEDLPEKLKYPLLRHFHEGQSQADIARELSISRPAVSLRIKRGVGLLRSRLKKRGVFTTGAALASLLSANLVQAAPPALMAALGNMALKGPTLSIATATGTTTTLWATVVKSVAVIGCIVSGVVATHVYHLQREAGEPGLVQAEENQQPRPVRATGSGPETASQEPLLPEEADGEVDPPRDIGSNAERPVRPTRPTRGTTRATPISSGDGASGLQAGVAVANTIQGPGRIDCTVAQGDAPSDAGPIEIVVQHFPDGAEAPLPANALRLTRTLDGPESTTFSSLPLGDYEITVTVESAFASAKLSLTNESNHVEKNFRLDESGRPLLAGSVTPRRVDKLEYPEPHFGGAPLDYWGPNLELEGSSPSLGRQMQDDVWIISRGRPVSSSNETYVRTGLRRINDGIKDYGAENVVTLPAGPQWVQIHLGGEYDIHAVLLWHFYEGKRVYYDVRVSLSMQPDGRDGIQLYNNDHDNSLGYGVGVDNEYVESNEGRFIRAHGEVARYVRCHSNGNTSSEDNHYIEVEVWGRPAR